MPLFNNGAPLQVVLCESHGSEDLGILSFDHGRNTVWMGHDLTPTKLEDSRNTKSVAVLKPPANYGAWVTTSIGGVSATVRRTGLLRVMPSESPVTIFAVQAPSVSAAAVALQCLGGQITIGDTEFDPEHKYVTEVVVHRGENVARVAACIARSGATPMLEDSRLNTKRSLGIERLDRISAKVVVNESMVEEKDALFGMRRGIDNWTFSWMPPHWKEPPITWDHMVRNVQCEPIDELPQPLRQHVAKTRIDEGDFPPIGSRWEVLPERDVPSCELIEWNTSLPADGPLDGIFRRVIQLNSDDQQKVREGRDAACAVPLNCITCIDGVWHRPLNTRSFLDKCLLKGGRRWVTPQLTKEQSKQLIDVFYLLTVEGVENPVQQRACKLILFRYMVERGYTARWIGKYDQDGNHVGNGNTFRMFRRLSQYAPERLPTDVLNKLCDRDGRLKNKGSKGTRSKYKQGGATKRYVPKRRLLRSKEDEARLLRAQ